MEQEISTAITTVCRWGIRPDGSGTLRIDGTASGRWERDEHGWWWGHYTQSTGVVCTTWRGIRCDSRREAVQVVADAFRLTVPEQLMEAG